MTTDTPRTDAARERYYDGKTADWVHFTISMMLERELAASQAEVERLKSQLNRAIDIAEEFWKNQKQAVLVYHGELADELAELKGEIKRKHKNK